MIERTPLSKKIRFEVFKRDKFTCQYCGQKAPDIVLHVDHIMPVAKGGDNNIINLITSCFECNNGKRDNRLDDNSVVEKQRKQLELLQERREQIELMLEWKKSLSTFDNDVVEMIVEYVNSKIKPLSLNDHGEKSVSDWLVKFTVERILNGIDEAAKKYLKYNNGDVEKESAELFLSKIAGVIIYQDMPPIKKKIAYIKGIARNRFGYWDDQKGAIIINTYLSAGRNYGWSDEQVLHDLETEVEPLTKNSKNWSDWKNTLEKWTDDINGWTVEEQAKVTEVNINAIEISLAQLESSARYEIGCTLDRIEALVYIGNAFEEFNEQLFRSEAAQQIEKFLSDLKTLYNSSTKPEIDPDEDYVFSFVQYCGIMKHFDAPIENDRFGFLFVLSDQSEHLLNELFTEFYLPKTSYKKKDIDILFKLYDELLRSQAKN